MLFKQRLIFFKPWVEIVFNCNNSKLLQNKTIFF